MKLVSQITTETTTINAVVSRGGVGGPRKGCAVVLTVLEAMVSADLDRVDDGGSGSNIK